MLKKISNKYWKAWKSQSCSMWRSKIYSLQKIHSNLAFCFFRDIQSIRVAYMRLIQLIHYYAEYLRIFKSWLWSENKYCQQYIPFYALCNNKPNQISCGYDNLSNCKCLSILCLSDIALTVQIGAKSHVSSSAMRHTTNILEFMLLTRYWDDVESHKKKFLVIS